MDVWEIDLNPAKLARAVLMVALVSSWLIMPAHVCFGQLLSTHVC